MARTVVVWVALGAASAHAAAPTDNAAFEMASSADVVVLKAADSEHSLTVEVVDTPAGRARGLMERDSLAPEAGMLFLYDRQQGSGNAFWMYQTRIPLDIAFLDAAGVIRALATMSPCRSEVSRDCPVYPAGAPFRAALETNAGYFEARGLEIGDRVDLSPWLEAR